MNQYTPTCNCYVANLEPVHQFTLRYGAHDTDCPAYRMSRDPVDNMKDEMARAHFQHLEKSHRSRGRNHHAS